jgi:hypothetical protein
MLHLCLQLILFELSFLACEQFKPIFKLLSNYNKWFQKFPSTKFNNEDSTWIITMFGIMFLNHLIEDVECLIDTFEKNQQYNFQFYFK